MSKKAQEIIEALGLDKEQAKVVTDILAPESKKDKIIALGMTQKYTIGEIAKKVGSNYPYTCSVLKKHGIKVPRKKDSRISSERNKEIIKAVKEGETLLSIGKRYGITRERVRQIAKREGVYVIMHKKLKEKIQKVKKDVNSGVKLSHALRNNSVGWETFNNHAPKFVEKYKQEQEAARIAKLEVGAQMVKRGISIRKSAKEIGVVYNTLGEYCAKRGIKSRFKSRWEGKGKLEKMRKKK